MPEESINTFINNIVALIIFTALVIFIFLLFLLISRLILIRTKRRLRQKADGKKPIDYEKNFNSQFFKVAEERKIINFKRDPFILKNIFVIGITFVLMVLSVIILLLSFHVIKALVIGPSLYIIGAIFFILFISSIYIIRSRILD